MPATSSSTFWFTLWLPIAGVVTLAAESEPGAVVGGILGAIFYAVRGISAKPSYRVWHFFRALLSGATAAVLIGALAAGGIPGYAPGVSGALLAGITCLAGTLGADGLEAIGQRAVALVAAKPTQDTPHD